MKIVDAGIGTFRELKENHLVSLAPRLAYFFLLSLFPLLICMVLIMGIFLGTRAEANALLQEYLTSLAPESASKLISSVLKDITSGSSPWNLSLAVIVTFWSSSRGTLAMIEGLNRTYGIREERPWWKRNLISLGLTLAFLFLLTALLSLILVTSPFAMNFLSKAGISAKGIEEVTVLMKWPVLLLLSSVTLGLIYKLGPAKPQKNVLMGITSALFLWILSSILFRTYLTFFGRFNATYGSLSAVMILMIWLYLTGLSVLIGAAFQKAWGEERRLFF